MMEIRQNKWIQKLVYQDEGACLPFLRQKVLDIIDNEVCVCEYLAFALHSGMGGLKKHPLKNGTGAEFHADQKEKKKA